MRCLPSTTSSPLFLSNTTSGLPLPPSLRDATSLTTASARAAPSIQNKSDLLKRGGGKGAGEFFTSELVGDGPLRMRHDVGCPAVSL